MSHVNASCHMWMCHVTCECVMSRVNVPCHMWMSHVTCECAMSHVNESCHMWMSHVTCKWVMPHVNESCLTWMSSSFDNLLFFSVSPRSPPPYLHPKEFPLFTPHFMYLLASIRLSRSEQDFSIYFGCPSHQVTKIKISFPRPPTFSQRSLRWLSGPSSFFFVVRHIKWRGLFNFICFPLPVFQRSVRWLVCGLWNWGKIACFPARCRKGVVIFGRATCLLLLVVMVV